MKTARLFAVFAAISVASSLFGQIAYYDMSSLTGTASSVAVTTFDSNLQTATSITRGEGLTAASGTGVFSSTSWSFGSASIAPLSNNDYITFSLAAAGGYEIAISSLSLKVSGSATAPATLALYSSTDNFTTNASQISTNQTYTATNTASPNTLSFTLGTSIVSSALQIRLFGFGTLGPAGGVPANTGSIRLDDITVNGTVSAVPEPSTYAAIFGAVALMGAALHRRRQRAKAVAF